MAKAPQYKRFTRSRAGNFFFFLFILLAGLFTILPLIYCVTTSFKPMDELMAFPPRFFVTRPTLSNYAALPGLLSTLRIPISRFILNSLLVSLAVTVGHVIVAGMAAFTLSTWKNKFTVIVNALVQMALLYNAYTLGTPQYLIFAKTGVIDTYLAYILPALPSAMGIFLMKQYMDGNVPAALIEAARIDGASYYRIFGQIVMPLARPAWLTLALFAFRDSWAMQPGGTIFSESLKTLPVVLGQIGTDIARAGSIMASTVLMMIPPIVVYMLSQSHVMETMSTAGIKD